MKHFLLLLLLLLIATPARADDSISSFQWNSTKNTFQALTRALGWKDVPDQDATAYALTCSTWCTSFNSNLSTAYVARTGKSVTLCLQVSANSTAGVTGAMAFGGMPAAYRPTRDAFLIADPSIGGAFKAALVRVRTTGEVWFYGDTAATAFPSSSVLHTNSGDQICLSYNLQ